MSLVIKNVSLENDDETGEVLACAMVCSEGVIVRRKNDSDSPSEKSQKQRGQGRRYTDTPFT